MMNVPPRESYELPTRTRRYKCLPAVICVVAAAVAFGTARGARAETLFDRCPRPQPKKEFHSRATATQFGKLVITAEAGARVYIDGRFIAPLNAADASVSVGAACWPVAAPPRPWVAAAASGI